MPTITFEEAANKKLASKSDIAAWAKAGLLHDGRDDDGNRTVDEDELACLVKTLADGKGAPYAVLKSDKHFDKATCIDLFAGAGGTALGFHNAGFHHTLLNEYDKYAVETLRLNNKALSLGWDEIDGRDVREVDFTGMKAEVIQAGYPCQAFSNAGKRRGFEDTRGTMFFEFARAIRDIQPKIAIGENVKGLVQHDHGNTLKMMIAALDELGYDTEWRILRSHFLDVPQKRERVILFASKRGSGCDIIFPQESKQFVTLRSALAGVPKSEGLEYNDAKKKVMALVPEGGNWRDLPDDVARSYMGGAYGTDGGKTGMARRLAWNEPALTLTCHPAQKQTERCHPSEDRPLTVREYARIQCFPDEWEFAGTALAQYKQIGNAVPVNLGYHVARCVLASLGYIDFDPETMEKI